MEAITTSNYDKMIHGTVITSDKTVTITDIDMKFGSMVNFMVKATFASIPAVIIVTIIIWGGIAILGLMFGRSF